MKKLIFKPLHVKLSEEAKAIRRLKGFACLNGMLQRAKNVNAKVFIDSLNPNHRTPTKNRLERIVIAADNHLKFGMRFGLKKLLAKARHERCA